MSESHPHVYLLDIEGTVAPLTLTAEVLFPYARAHFEPFLLQSDAEAETCGSCSADALHEGSVWRDLMMLGFENRSETDPEAPRIWPIVPSEAQVEGMPRVTSMTPAEAIPKFLAYIYWLMDRDRKSTALKSLQGKIWKAGFESGELKGTLFDDVPEAFRRWSPNGKIAIYSSGSIEAQKLLFRHSTFGDLTGLISDHFDTRTGPKQASASYAEIAAAMHTEPQHVLFLSDVVLELDAAAEAGCETRLVVRPGNPAVEQEHGHQIVATLARL